MRADPNSSDTQHATRPGRRVVWIVGAVLLSLGLSLAAGEWALRVLRRHVEASDRLDDGLVAYDKRLGWVLAPDWQGRHHHYDFDAAYSTNGYGFRGPFPEAQEGTTSAGLYAVLGDSFTFGLGVNDEETFVSRLNQGAQGDRRYLNLSVVGFSTDQECLLLEERAVMFRPGVVVVVVYLANDLLDNTLAFPVQAEHAKPYFEQTTEGLILRQVPVPASTKPPELRGQTLGTMILGQNGGDVGRVRTWLNGLEWVRRMGMTRLGAGLAIDFAPRVQPQIDLFRSIVSRMERVCASHNATLVLSLLPGRSFIEHPGGLSARYQDYLRRQIVAEPGAAGVQVIDLASLMLDRHGREGGRWYYPNEGHLTPLGNQVVADLLASTLPEAQ
jgi:lysophospholipase L1-like esterase